MMYSGECRRAETDDQRKREMQWRSNRLGNERLNQTRRDNQLSPLRSPLREDNSQKKTKHDLRQPRYTSNCRRSPRKSVEAIKAEFPPLSDEAWTPDGGKKFEGQKLDWSLCVEEEERQEKSRRKLDLREKLNKKPNTKTSNQKTTKKPLFEVETDDKTLTRRQKDLDYGKNTVAYDRYRSLIQIQKRAKGVHPRTPNKRVKTSRRSWDAQVRQWRRMLHQWDPPSAQGSSGLDLLKEIDDEDTVSECSDIPVSVSIEMMDSTNTSDADDEYNSQTSTSPGIMLTPDLPSGRHPFSYPKAKLSANQSESAPLSSVPAKTEKENDDGFFSGFDLEDMETL